VDHNPHCAIEVKPGNNNRFENLWLEHAKCGFWVSGANNLTIKNCRIRNVFADGINLSFQTKNSTVENCDLRNLGDDAIALNSEQNRDCNNNTVKNNTVRVPYHASGIAIYGGGNNVIQDNVVYDTVAYGGGINISSRFNPADFYGTTSVRGNVLVRTGSSAFASERKINQGAIWLVAWEKDISGIKFSGNRLIDSPYDGITIDGNGASVFSGITFENTSIENVQGSGICVHSGAVGSASFKRTSFSGVLGLTQDSSSRNFIVRDL
jgi:parallel beta-helix repeat protein